MLDVRCSTFITNALETWAKIEVFQKSVGQEKINTTQMYDKRLVNHSESGSFACGGNNYRSV